MIKRLMDGWAPQTGHDLVRQRLNLEGSKGIKQTPSMIKKRLFFQLVIPVFKSFH